VTFFTFGSFVKILKFVFLDILPLVHPVVLVLSFLSWFYVFVTVKMFEHVSAEVVVAVVNVTTLETSSGLAAFSTCAFTMVNRPHMRSLRLEVLLQILFVHEVLKLLFGFAHHFGVYGPVLQAAEQNNWGLSEVLRVVNKVIFESLVSVVHCLLYIYSTILADSVLMLKRATSIG
jgi:hypothetical protein